MRMAASQTERFGPNSRSVWQAACRPTLQEGSPEHAKVRRVLLQGMAASLQWLGPGECMLARVRKALTA